MLVMDITCIIYSRLMPSAGVGGRVGSVEARRAISEGSWLESRSWRFTDCGLILGMCHPSSQPTPTAGPQKACVTDYRFLTLYDHSSRKGR